MEKGNNVVPDWLKNGTNAAVALAPASVASEPPPVPAPFPPNALHKLGLLVTFVQEEKSKDYNIKVEFTGKWEGKFLKASVKSIEREYKRIQHNMVRATITKKIAALNVKE